MIGRVVFNAKSLMIAAVALLLPLTAEAGLPFITDDTGTQGRGKFQLEAAAAYDRDRNEFFGVTGRESDYTTWTTVTGGVAEALDLAVTVPYSWTSSSDDRGAWARTDGFSDTVISAKWRFLEKRALTLALKPFVTLPTGNDAEDLGTGKVDCGLFFITSSEHEPWSLNINAGYLRNLNTVGERTDIWMASASLIRDLTEHWEAGIDAGIQTNTDRISESEPRYVLLGIVYKPAENIEFAIGLKQGFTKEQNDWSILPGITFRF